MASERSSLSEAFEAQGSLFPGIYTASLLAGEKSGSLEQDADVAAIVVGDGGLEVLVPVNGLPEGTAVIRVYVTPERLHEGVMATWLVLLGIGLTLMALVVLPTGFGKSACYQIPSMILPKPVVLISPLLALLRDQHNTSVRAGSVSRSPDRAGPAPSYSTGHALPAGGAR